MKKKTWDWELAENQEGISLQGEWFRLECGGGERFSLLSLEGKGEKEWLGEFREIDTVWKISFRGPDGTSPVYSAHRAEYLGASIPGSGKHGKEAVFSWKLKLSERGETLVRVRVSVESGHPLSFWEIEVQTPPGWIVDNLEFPVIPNIRPGNGLELLAPAGWGTIQEITPGFLWEARYPSWQSVMQMIAMLRNGQGLYLASLDPGGNLKDFTVRAGEKAVEAAAGHLFPREPAPGGIFKLPYRIALGLFPGDYIEAANIYREFSYETPWGGKGSVTERNIPSRLLENDLWLRPDGDPGKNREITDEALRFFGVPTALHWYRWHQIPYDTHYPEYFPPLPGFRDTIGHWQNQGALVMVYINGRLWDPSSKSWKEKGAARFAALKPDGSCYTEIYGSGVPNNVMCPSTGLWRETVAGLAGRLTGEYGLNGVYIDQVSAAGGVPCHNPDHDHPPGGGAFWYEGYRRLLEELRTVVKPGAILTSEENAECWLDCFDAQLMANSPVDGRLVPLFPAVYSDRAVLLGCLYFSPGEPEDSLPFRLKNARAFLWGAQPGWIQPSRIMPLEVRKEAEFLRNLARMRQKARPFILGGRFLGMIEPEGDNPRITGTAPGPFHGSYPIDETSVLGSKWVSPEGKCGILLVNISDRECRVCFPVPFEREGAMDRDAAVAVHLWGEPPRAISVTNDAIELVMPPRQGAVVEMSSLKSAKKA